MSAPSVIEENRNQFAGFLLTVLIGFAFERIAQGIGAALSTPDQVVRVMMLATTFFFVAMRFYIGNLAYIAKQSSKLAGEVWLYDVMVITLESIAIVLLAGLVLPEEERISHLGFFEMLVILYALDVSWIASQWALGKLFKSSWRRDRDVDGWLLLNLLLLASMALVQASFDDVYSPVAMSLLLAINAVGFIVDLFLIDFARTLRVGFARRTPSP